MQQYYSQPLRFSTDDATMTSLNVTGLQPDTKYKVQVGSPPSNSRFRCVDLVQSTGWPSLILIINPLTTGGGGHPSHPSQRLQKTLKKLLWKGGKADEISLYIYPCCIPLNCGLEGRNYEPLQRKKISWNTKKNILKGGGGRLKSLYTYIRPCCIPLNCGL